MTKQETDIVCKLIEAAWARNDPLVTALMLQLIAADKAASAEILRRERSGKSKQGNGRGLHGRP